MKKIVIFIISVLFLLGVSGCCGNNPAVFKNWDHLKYSCCGYKNPASQETSKQAQNEGWWGKTVVEPGVAVEPCE